LRWQVHVCLDLNALSASADIVAEAPVDGFVATSLVQCQAGKTSEKMIPTDERLSLDGNQFSNSREWKMWSMRPAQEPINARQNELEHAAPWPADRRKTEIAESGRCRCRDQSDVVEIYLR